MLLISILLTYEYDQAAAAAQAAAQAAGSPHNEETTTPASSSSREEVPVSSLKVECKQRYKSWF